MLTTNDTAKLKYYEKFLKKMYVTHWVKPAGYIILLDYSWGHYVTLLKLVFDIFTVINNTL